VYGERDADWAVLAGAPVAVLGYGNQGRAHALNLRDSGLTVRVGQRGGPRFDEAQKDGFRPTPLRDAVEGAGLMILALPDDRMPAIYDEQVAPRLTRGQTLGFIHGFNVHFGRIRPPPDVDVVMVAPKGPGRLLRRRFEVGSGLAALLAVHHDAAGRAREAALGWAAGIGSTRVGVIETTFAHETVTDLFGEQTVLCGGVVELMKAAFEALTEAGYPPELASVECVHEVKQIVDLIYEGGVEFMRERISSTARFGGLTRGPDMVPASVREAMRAALADIEGGGFARRFSEDTASGGVEMDRLQAREASHAMLEARRTLARQLPLMFRGEASPGASG
jgi:ketol-acid reductoisomerase